MRTIKFRAWDKKENKWLSFDEDDPIQDDFGYAEDKYWTFEFDFNEDRVVLMQYTGLKDKNGKEIYQGDIFIVKNLHDGDEYIWDNPNQKPVPQVVTWSEGDCGFNFGDSHRIKYQPYDFEVIGNIYENKDLLKL